MGNSVLALFTFTGRVFSAIFGHLQWQLPHWLAWIVTQLRRVGQHVRQFVRAKPKAAFVALIAAVALAGGSWWGYQWWQAQPKPFEATFKVTDPPRTRIEDESFTITPLVVRFNASVAPLAAAGKTVSDGLSISPPLEGVWKWQSDRELQFAPRADWPVGERYKVSLGAAAFAPQARLAERELSFKTAAFVAKVAKSEFYQDPRDPALKKGVFELNFTFPVDAAELEKRLSLELEEAQKSSALGTLGALVSTKSAPKFTVSYDKLKLNAYVHSAALPLPKERSTLMLTIAKGLKSSRGGNVTEAEMTQSVAVPGLYSLTINEVSPTIASNERYEPEQVLLAVFSATVHEKDVIGATKAWTLPVYHPKTPKDEREGPYEWSDQADITPEVLKQSAKLALEPIAAEREWSESHSFKYKADVGRFVFVQVDKNVKSFGGYLLPKAESFIIKVPPYPSELKILSEGALLALSGEKKVATLVRDLPGLRVEIGRVLPGQLQHLISQTTGNFANPTFDGTFGQDNLTERFEKKIALTTAPGKPHYEAIDLGDYLRGNADRKGVFLLTLQGYDPKKEESAKKAEDKAKADKFTAREEPATEAEVDTPMRNRSEGEGEGDGGGDVETQRDPTSLIERRLVLVTDLGVIIKKSTDGTQDVFVQSIFGGAPVAGASVEIVAKNGLTIATQTTDATGRAHFAKIEGATREKAPLLAIIKKGNDLSFMPLNRSDRNLDYSRFDVGGERNARSAEQLNAFLFSDRGIYRPGETMKIGMVVKTADWGKQAAGLPLEAEVLDARGLVVKRERIKLPAGGFTELTHATQETSPTGNWSVNLYIVKDGKPGAQIGSTSVRVQEFQPDRMKVQARLSQEPGEGWVSPKDLKGLVNAQNLFGTAAENRRVEASLTLSPTFPAFKGYADYKFYDPLRAKESFNEALAQSTTNDKGEVQLDLGLSKYAKATYRLHLLTQVFEPEGGRAVSADTSAMVSELPYLLGFKADGELNFVSRASKRMVNLIAIDSQAKRTAVEGLKLQLQEVKFVSVLTKQSNGTYKYESKKKEVSISDNALSLPTVGFNLALNTDTPGTFAYVLRDAVGVELNRVEYTVAGKGNVSRSLERNAELQLTLNKKDYLPGEDIEIAIKAPYAGAGLISIERDTVITHQWFKSDTTASTQRIRLPANFEGNGYVSVQFIRDPASDEIFTSPLSYGVVPFATSLDKRTNKLTLTAPELVKSGQVVKMKLASERPSRAVVFAVDEGILQVARYQAPEPLKQFYAKRALEVRTAQILDMILPEFKKVMAAAAPGGDAESLLGRNLNPFKRRKDKPAVYWSGIVELNGERDFTYTVPESFNGSLKVFALAVNDDTIGIAQAKTLVRSDFVIAPNMPLAVAPGDEFDVSVGVTNSVKGSGKALPVTLTANLPAGIEVVGEKSVTLQIDELREQVAQFRFRAKAALGSAGISFNASGGTKASKLTSDVSIRPATPYRTVVSIGAFTKSTEVPIQRDLFAELRKSSASVSVVPLGLATGLGAYLADYPHLCTEQLTSRAFADLILAKRPELKLNPTAANDSSYVSRIVSVLRSRQNADGGFGLWQAGVQADEYASVHAVHWLIEAKERGEAVPADLMQRSLEWLTQYAASPIRDTDTGMGGLSLLRNRAYAAYLLTRSGVVTTPIVASLRESLEARFGGAKKDEPMWQDDVAASYLAASYQLLKQEKTAADLISRPLKALGSDSKPLAWGYYYDATVRDAQTLNILARHFPQRAKALPSSTLLALTKPLQEGRYNTLSSAYLILALDAYVTTLGPGAAAKLAMTEVDAKGAATALNGSEGIVQRAVFSLAAKQLRFTNESDLNGYYAVVEAGFDREPPATELKQGMEVLREYVDKQGQPLTSVKVGDEVLVRLRFRAIDRATLSNVALTDLLPGGFEPVVNERAQDAQGEAPQDKSKPYLRIGSSGGWGAEYADVREDRVVLYGTVSSSMSEFVYRIRATNAGTFIVPPAYGESMYERSIQARSAAGKITVERVAKK